MHLTLQFQWCVAVVVVVVCGGVCVVVVVRGGAWWCVVVVFSCRGAHRQTWAVGKVQNN